MKFLKLLHRESNIEKLDNGNNLQKRFLFGVLLPPFVVLLILGVIIYWQLDIYIRSKAIEELRRAAASTSVKIEREISIRQTILQSTGDELFVVKNDYDRDKELLDKNKNTCSEYVKAKRTFLGAPDNACNQFLPEFATGLISTNSIDKGHIRVGNELIENQNKGINDRLSAFKLFFPETVALLIVDTKGNTVSSAESKTATNVLDKLVKLSKNSKQINGDIHNISDLKIAIFAYSIENGYVYAGFDVNNENYINNSWSATPIDKSKAIALIVQNNGEIIYPSLENKLNLKNLNTSNNIEKSFIINYDKTNYIALSSKVSGANWSVLVASPTAVVLAPMRDAQFVAVLIIGSLIVGFLWVGAYFIQKTLKSIIRLVSGALVFSSGKLDYKINLVNSDIEFISLANTMNNMAERIAVAEKELDEKNKEFISVATHELRTPLTAILGNLSMVFEDMGDKLDSVIKPMIEDAFTGTKRLRDLVTDMLDIARVESGRAEFKITKINTKEFVSSYVKNLQVTAQEKSVSLNYIDAGVVDVKADETKLGIILNNFISNAIKYNRPNGSVTLSHKLKDKKLVFVVADTGLGIPEDQKAHMFEKFFRVQNDDRKDVVGTGLGMYITKQYIEKMGGELWFDSVHGTGTTFYFTLPVFE